MRGTSRLALFACLACLSASCATTVDADRLHLQVLADGAGFSDRHGALSPDGEQVAFASVREGSQDLYVAAVSTGEVRQLTNNNGNEYAPSWSPDGRRIAYSQATDEGVGIWITAADGRGEPERLTPPEQNAEIPRWSPDGARIVYTGDGAGSRDIWIIEVTTRERTRVTQHPENEWHPDWSPDGRRIVFYTTWNGEMTEVYVVDADGANLRRITNNPAEDYAPVWGPDSRRVAFSSRREGSATDIWIVDVDSGALTRVTHNASISGATQWFHDGRLVVMAKAPNAQIFAVDAQSGAVRKLTQGAAEHLSPAAHPRGGARLAYVSDQVGKERTIVLHDLQSGAVTPLGDGEALQASPSWSRDGSELAFMMSRGGWVDDNNLFVWNASTGDIRQATTEGYVNSVLWCGDALLVNIGSVSTNRREVIARASPSGGPMTQLYRHVGEDLLLGGCDPSGQRFIYTIDSAQGRAFIGTTSGAPATPLNTPAGARGMMWSPDGLRLAYLMRGEAGVGADLFVGGPAGAGATRLAHLEGDASGLSWSADGRTLYVGADLSDWGVFALGAP